MHILPHPPDPRPACLSGLPDRPDREDPVLAALAGNHAAILALSDERQQALASILSAEARGFTRGRAIGREEGRRAEQFDTAAAQRLAADHVVPHALGSADGGYARLLVRRWAPRGWRGVIPSGMGSFETRRWLAHLHRKDDYRPSPASTARIAATWRRPR